MGKTYFNLSDNLNFNGKAIKIKANATEPIVQEERNMRSTFPIKIQSQVYQSVLASQPQINLVRTDSSISIETLMRFLSSSAQLGRINIVGTDKTGYLVKTNVVLNKVTTGAPNMGGSEYSRLGMDCNIRIAD